MDKIEQAREAAAGMRSGAMTLNQIRHVWPTAIDALIAELAALKAALQERDAEIERLAGSELGLNRYLATVQTELASIRGQP